MDYRREIDGLRALAVIPVILFHAGLETFSGGFVGVDVFFVISGYLITSIILAGRQSGTFTLAGFYERRARRILPALFLVLFACLPAAWLLLLPADLELFSSGLVAVTFFGSNFLFHATSGYFEAAAETNPLLHTWSLAVEEQYYLLFPLFLLLAWRLGTRTIVALLVLATLASFAMADWGSTRHPSFTFYMLPTRGWELLAGALAAFWLAAAPARTPATAPLTQALAAAGLALIVYAVCAFDRETPFPGRYALVPVIGTVLVILFAHARTLAGRCLGHPLLVGIGLVSYSAYLWHQPLLAFSRHYHADALPAAWLAALLAVNFLLAWASWRFVESPFRDRRRTRRRTVVIAGTAAAALLVTAGLAGLASQGLASRLSDTQRAVAAWANYDFADEYRSGRCFLQPGDAPHFAPACAGLPGTTPVRLLWGDSYAAALSSGLRAQDPGLAQYTSSGCPPVLDATIARRKNCREINARILAAIGERQPRDVVLHANWHAYEREGALERLPATLARIRAVAPAARIILVGGVPQWSPTLPVLLVRRNIALDREQDLAMPFYPQLARADTTIAGIASAHGVTFVSALAILCTAGHCRAVIASGDGYAPMAWDKGHLTAPGSRYLADRLGLDR